MQSLEEKQKQEISTFLEHLRQSAVCVHPTDTVSGLTCDPTDENGIRSLELIKKRTQKKSFVGLVPSFEQALEFWQPLPEFWRNLIPRIWPQTISFVWKARANVPRCLVSEQGELALRNPRLKKGTEWFQKVMEQVDFPIPSTSINYEGQPPILGGKKLRDFCKQHSIYLPTLLADSEGESGNLPSSVLRIMDEKNFEWLRIGAFSEKDFLKEYNEQS